MRQGRLSATVRYGLSLLLLLLLEIVTPNPWILTGMILLLLLPPGSWLANGWVCRHIRGKFSLPPTAAKGSACSGTLTLNNSSWWPILNLNCRIRLTNDLTGETVYRDILTAIGPKQSVQQEFLLESSHCGRIYITVESVKLFDFFALVFRKAVVKADARVTILPELFPCEIMLMGMALVDDDSTAFCRGEDPTEVFQLREYRSGDDVRRIHWKLSSKLDTLLLRESSQNVSRSLLVFWDKREPCEPEIMDTLAETAASVCQGLCEDGIAFDLVWTEHDELEQHQIRDEEALIQTIPALVTRMGSRECPIPDLSNYGQVLYLTSVIPEQEYGESCLYLLCSRDAQEAKNVCVFSPEDYREKMERLEM